MYTEQIVKSKILVVDDMVYNRLIITNMLNSHGFTNIDCVASAKEAFAYLEKNVPAVILLDVFLPDINGIDLCKRIKQNKALSDIPVIMQSYTLKKEDVRKAFDYGASDFVAKPIDEIELVSRVKTQLQNQFYHRKILDSNIRMYKELNDANEMLLSLLPSADEVEKIIKKYRISIATFFKSSSELGGDFYEILDLNDGRIFFYLWDFSGHGVSAAINTFRLQSIIQDSQLMTLTPGEFLTKLNLTLTSILEVHNYATLFCCILDINEKKLHHSAAACPGPILLNSQTKERATILTREFPLGVKHRHVYQTFTTDISNFDTIILYSDALIETADENGNYYTSEQLTEDFLQIFQQKTGKEKLSLTLTELTKNFLNQHAKRLEDDLTISVIKFQ
jgi:sigma-B regulation protein RsbU (phosphoserine phosphatase)